MTSSPSSMPWLPGGVWLLGILVEADSAMNIFITIDLAVKNNDK